MPVHCTFSLNNQDTSDLYCSGYGTVKAFSGAGRGRDNPDATATPDVGPLPRGTYYIVDRQSGKLLTSLGEIGKLPGQFDQAHSIAVDSKNNLYVGENRGRRIHRFKPVGP